jgi:uncharacterized cupin superfamily protein
MSKPKTLAIEAAAVPPRAKATNYPAPFVPRVAGRVKRPLGDHFGLNNFGVNLTRLHPGAQSSLHHRHSRQDEFVYLLEGEVVVVSDTGETTLRPGMCAGFVAGSAAHHLVNRSQRDAVFIEVGDRALGDEVSYPLDDLKAVMGSDGRRHMVRKDGTPY